MWKPCTHKTHADFSFRRDDGKLVWECSHCKKRALWSDSWGYYGTIECRRCWCAAMEFVWCSEPCRLELKKNHPKCVDEATGKRAPRSPRETTPKTEKPKRRRWSPCVAKGPACAGPGGPAPPGDYAACDEP